MDPTRFDAVARLTTVSRRRGLQALVAAALGGLIAAWGGDASARTCRRKGERCRERSQCCGHQFSGRAIGCQSMEGCGLNGDRCCVRPGGPCNPGGCECCGTSYCGPEAVCV